MKYYGINLGNPIEVYDNHIVCIAISNMYVKTNDLLVAKTNSPYLPYRGGEIKEIQIDNVSYPELPRGQETVNIALRVDFKAKDNYTYFLIHTHPEVSGK